MRVILALASAVVGAAAASNWQTISSIFVASSGSVAGSDLGALDAIVDKISKRIALAQPPPQPSVLVLPPAMPFAASSIWAAALPFGLVAASSFAFSRYFSAGESSISAVAQASVAAAVEHLRSAVTAITCSIDALREHCDARSDALQQVCDSGFEHVRSDIAGLQGQVTRIEVLQQRQLESNARLEENVAALVVAANGLRAGDARDFVRPVEMQAVIGSHAARHDLLMQMRSGALLRA